MSEKIISAIKTMVIIIEQNCSMMKTKTTALEKAFRL